MPDKSLALDKMVDFLAEEDEYWRRTMTDTRLKQARKDQKTKSQAAHTSKRRRLSHYYDRTKDITRRSESIDVWDIDTEDTVDTVDLFPSGLDNTGICLPFIWWFKFANTLLRRYYWWAHLWSSL